MANKVEKIVSFKAEGIQELLSGIGRIKRELATIGMSSTRNATSNLMGSFGGLQAYGPVSSLKEMASLIREYKSLVRDLKSIGLLGGNGVPIESVTRDWNRNVAPFFNAGRVSLSEITKQWNRSNAYEFRSNRVSLSDIMRQWNMSYANRVKFTYGMGPNDGPQISQWDYLARRMGQRSEGRVGYGLNDPEAWWTRPTNKASQYSGLIALANATMGPNDGPQIVMGPNDGPQIDKGTLEERINRIKKDEMFRLTGEWMMNRPGIYEDVRYEGMPNKYEISSTGEFKLISGIERSVERGAEKGTQKGIKDKKGEDEERKSRNAWKREGLRGFMKGASGSGLGVFSSKAIGAYDNILGPDATGATAAGQIFSWVIDGIKFIHKNATEYAKFRTNMMTKGILGGMTSGQAQDYYYFGEMMGEGRGGGTLSHMASMNLALQDMLMGGDGGGLTEAALRYGVDITGTGKGGLATIDEIYQRIAKSVDAGAYDKMQLADIFRLLGTDEATALAVSSGSVFYNAIQSRSKRASNATKNEQLDQMVKEFNAASGEYDASKLNLQAIAAALDLPLETVAKKFGADVLGMHGTEGAMPRNVHTDFGGEELVGSLGGLFNRGKRNYRAAQSAASAGAELSQRGEEVVSGMSARYNTGGTKIDKVEMIINTSASTMSGVGRDAAAAFEDEMNNRAITNNFGRSEK